MRACCLVLLVSASERDGLVVETSNTVIASRDGERLRVVFAAEEGPALLFRPREGAWDWRHTSKLVIPVDNPGGEPVTLLLRIEDEPHGSLSGKIAIAPGVRLLPLPGHTPGHMGVAFTSGQEMAIYVGDLVHHPLQIEHPDWSPIFDSLPQLSRETRRYLVERARREHSLVLSYHLPFPGIGHIGGTGWEPASLQPRN